jgi:putative ABC transport system permease protein
MKTNILIALRNIKKNILNSIITISGLTVAIACLLLIYIYVSQELGYNNFHQNKKNIFRINYSLLHPDGGKIETIYLDPKLSEVIKNEVPQVENCTAFRNAHKPTILFENHIFDEYLYITESDFFKIFDFKFLFGDKNKIFENPDEIIITSGLADKFMAVCSCTKEELLGKSVFFTNTGERPFSISGIIEDIPKNSSLQFDALIPYNYEKEFRSSSNMYGNSSIFYKTTRKENSKLAENQIIKMINEHYQSLVERNKSLNILANDSNGFVPFVLPITETYLSNVSTDYELKNSKVSLYVLSFIGLLILLIACINFILLTLGQSYKKVREVGIRKTMGAGKRNIFSLFFIDSFTLTFSSAIMGTELCFLLIPVFNKFAQNGIYPDLINIPNIIFFVLTCILIIVIATSLFPIVKLANIQANQMIIKKSGKGKRVGLTDIFVTFQYGLSIALIILTISIVHQVNFMKNKDLGFSSENIIYLNTYNIEKSEKLALRDRLKSFSGITDLTLADRDFIDGRGSNHIKSEQGEFILTRILNVDRGYISTLCLNILQGDNFNDDSQENQTAIINEKLMSQLGLNESPVGHIIKMDGRDVRIKGVVKDFHFDSMKEAIEPLMLIYRTGKGDRGNFILIKYQDAQIDKVIPFIQDTWKEIVPGKELDLRFWDEQLGQRYKAEEKWSQIIGYAALVAIIISSLGLFGLTILVINSKVKEIGIRKINGAHVSEVVVMLNRTFLKWVVIAIFIAAPVAFYAMQKWLEAYAYKASMSWWIFAFAGIIALGIALFTVSWQSWRAATRNPVEALRYE